MELSDVNCSLDNISLPVDQRKAILKLIDVKVNNDMREVIAEMKQIEARLEAKIQMTNDKIQMVHDKLSNEIKTVYWVVGIAMTVMIFVVSRK
ncbi:MAG TPA: hypothetical protein VHE34_08975 [Puia sp.]|uniref:hypothetical protein n=1 Tax=Puia sp. TaxID=2045100 RepID=UPI002B5954CB|nr:hypothetical protein [Puia sp.]HVU95344.1 hypothetical protein [Puia sp.]